MAIDHWSIDPDAGVKNYMSKISCLSKETATKEEVEMWNLLADVYQYVPYIEIGDAKCVDVMERVRKLVGGYVRICRPAI